MRTRRRPSAQSGVALALIAIAGALPALAFSSAAVAAPASNIVSSVEVLPGATDQATGVSCMPKGPCIAIDYSGQIYALSGSNVESLGALGVSTFGISCPTQSFCAVVGDDEALILRPSGVMTYLLADSAQSNTHWQSVSCSSPTFCMAGGGVIGGSQDGAGVVASWNGVDWSPAQVVLPDIPSDAKTEVSSMSCTSPTFCIAADQNDRELLWSGKRWSLQPFINNFGTAFSVSCSSRTFCMAQGYSNPDTLTWNGTGWHWRGTNAVDDFGIVSCLSPNDCVAVSALGPAQRWSGRGWTHATTVDGIAHDFIQGLSCSSLGFCEAVSEGDHFVYLSNPHKPPKLPVLCPTFGCKGTQI
jgi:hypothetical protein